MSEVILSDQNFEQEVLNSQKLVLVDFWSNWCPPCKIMNPIIEKIAKDYGDRIKICKLNVDEARQTAIAYGIEAIPTFLFFKPGKSIVEKQIGAVTEQILVQKIEKHI